LRRTAAVGGHADRRILRGPSSRCRTLRPPAAGRPCS